MSADGFRSGPSALVIGVAACVVFHLALGWAWTPLGGLLVAIVARRRPVLIACGSGIIAWGALALYSFGVDRLAVTEMTRVIGALLGDVPAFATVVVTLLLGGLLGAAGGWIGVAAGNLVTTLRR